MEMVKEFVKNTTTYVLITAIDPFDNSTEPKI